MLTTILLAVLGIVIVAVIFGLIIFAGACYEEFVLGGWDD